MITISHDALAYIKNYLIDEAKRTKLNNCLFDFKILVEKSGCNGLSYKLYPVTVAEICEEILTSNNYEKFHYWYKKEDAPLLKGASISLEKENLGYKIKIKNDLIAVSVCGCGKSFHLD